MKLVDRERRMLGQPIKDAKFSTVKSLDSCSAITPTPLHGLTGKLDVLCIACDNCGPFLALSAEPVDRAVLPAGILKP